MMETGTDLATHSIALELAMRKFKCTSNAEEENDRCYDKQRNFIDALPTALLLG